MSSCDCPYLIAPALACAVFHSRNSVSDLSGAAVAAKPGYPTVIVPYGMVPNAPAATAAPGGRGAGPNNTPFPSGFDAKPEPYGVSFTGMACSEPKLIELAYAFEQATKKRIPPTSFP